MKKRHHLQTLAILPIALCFGTLHGQENDPFVKKIQNDGPKPQAENLAMLSASESLPRNIQVTFEAFSLPIAEAAKINRQKLSNVESYELMIAMSEKGTAKQEMLNSLIALPGQSATTEGVQEYIYPTEYEPSNGYQKPTENDIAETKALAPMPTTPSAFDTKNLGATLEVEAQIAMGPTFVPLTEKGAALLLEQKRAQRGNVSDDPFAAGAPPESASFLAQLMMACERKDLRKINIVELRFTPTFVKHTGFTTWGQGPSETEMPTFEVQSIKTGVTLVAGEPFFMGTFSPFREAKDAPEAEEKVWFAYVTASIKTVGL